MKLLRHGPKGHEKPAMLDAQGQVRDLSGVIADLDAAALSPAGLKKLAAIDPASLPLAPAGARFGPPVAFVSKIIAVGLNYADHAVESGNPIPTEPVLFMKAVSSLSGPNDDVVIPRGSVKTDWEVELAVVIGTKASYVDEKDALDHVAGYAVANDVSEREFQIERGPTWDKGKGCDTFCPLGPWLVTKDEIPDPQNLSMYLDVNGHRFQDGSTKTMIFSVAHLVHYISQFMTLLPGDVIVTGTPPGVGLGKKPPLFLKAGDVMDVGIEGLGAQRQTTRAWTRA